jgi:hypothetical protein
MVHTIATNFLYQTVRKDLMSEDLAREEHWHQSCSCQDLIPSIEVSKELVEGES